MATLGRIRNHGVLLLIVIGVALLIFIVTDFVNNGSTFFREQRANVGSIDGEKVKYNDFFALINQAQDFVKVEQNRELDDNAFESIRQDVWNQLVMQTIVEKDARKIGMIVSKQELSDLIIGANPSPYISSRPMFQNPETGMFDHTMVARLIQELDNVSKSDGQNIDMEQVNRLRNYWKYLETNIKSATLIDKYNTLLSKALVVNSKEAQFAYNNSKTSVDVIYAMKPYFTIADSTINIDDKDIKALYDKRREQFVHEPSADISVVVFPISPSAEDIDAVKAQIDAAKAGFVAVSDSTIVDSVNYNSDVPYVDVFLSAQDVDADLKEFAFASSKNEVYGPIFIGNTFKMAKIVDTKMASDSVKLSLIALQEATPEATKRKADSIMNLAKTVPFAQLAAQNSLDKASGRRGGDIGWVREPMISQEIAKKAFVSPVGEPFMISNNNVTSIFVVTERTSPVKKVKLAVVQRQVVPSNGTQSKIFQDAKTFAGSVSNSSTFRKVADEKRYQVVPATGLDRNAPRVLGIADSRAVIRWAFESKKDATSDVFECNDNLIVAVVDNINTDKYRTLDEVKPQLLAELRRDKKFDILKGQLEGKTIAQLQADGMSVDSIKGLNFASRSAGSLGYEPAMIANAPFAEVGKTSAPKKGNMGAFVFEVISKAENSTPFDPNQTKMMLYRQNGNVFYYAMEALKKRYKVKDQRYNFF